MDPQFNQALERINQGHWQEAFGLLVALCKTHPEESQYRVKLSEVCLGLNRPADALRILKHLAATLISQRQMTQAIAVGKRILEIDPQDREVQKQLEDLYAQGSERPQDEWRKAQEKARQQVRATVQSTLTVGGDSLDMAGEGDRVTWSAAEMVGTVGNLNGSGLDIETAPGLDRSVSGADGYNSISFGGEDFSTDVSVSPIRRNKSLPKIPLFSDLPPGPFSRLIEQCERRSLATGETIIRQGDKGRCLYVLTYGKVGVIYEENFKEYPLAELAPGSFFGEMSYYSKGPREATVTAREMGEVLEVSYQVLDELLVEFPKVERALRNFYKERVLKNLFRRSELFASLNEKEVDQVCQKFEFMACKKGQKIVGEGEAADRFFVIQRGYFNVHRQGAPETLAELTAGEFFGEYSLITGSPRSASVTAAEDGMLLSLSAQGFKALLQGRPQVIEKIREIAKERIKDAQRKTAV